MASDDPAPRAPFELFSSLDLSEAVTIWPCRDCRSWHLEISPSGDAQHLAVREWHHPDCPHLRALLRDDGDE